MSLIIVGQKIHFGGYVLENRKHVEWVKGFLDANADSLWGTTENADALDTKGCKGQDEKSGHASEEKGVERDR